MFVSQECPLSRSPAGFLDPEEAAKGPPPCSELKPWEILRRTRPVSFRGIISLLHHYDRTITALTLLETHFPNEVARCSSPTMINRLGWWGIMAHLLNRVAEADWFDIDWELLDLCWAYWLKKRMEDRGRRLAAFLSYIPIKLYGFDQNKLLMFPPMHLMHVLLDENAPVASADILAKAEIYDGLESWTNHDRAAAWALLRAIEENPGDFNPSVKWLPELARWACHTTRNIILDHRFNQREGPWFSWDNDLVVLKSSWTRAKPVIGQFNKLMGWYEADTSRLSLLASFLMEGGSCDELDW